MISLNYDGVDYLNFSESELLRQNVPQSVIDAKKNKQAWDEVREKRQLLLYKTDWTQGKDTPLAAEKVTAFATYRQALRDIPQNVGNPDDVVWPTPPVL